MSVRNTLIPTTLCWSSPLDFEPTHLSLGLLFMNRVAFGCITFRTILAWIMSTEHWFLLGLGVRCYEVVTIIEIVTFIISDIHSSVWFLISYRL